MQVNNQLPQNVPNQNQPPQVDTNIELQPVLAGKLSDNDFNRLALKDKSFMDAILTVLRDQNIPLESVSKATIKGIPSDDTLHKLKNPANDKDLKYSSEHPTKKEQTIKKKDIQVQSFERNGVEYAKIPLQVELTINENGTSRKISFEKNFFTNVEIPLNTDLKSREFADFKDTINMMIIGLRDQTVTPLMTQDHAAIRNLTQTKTTFFHFTRNPTETTHMFNSVFFRGRVTSWKGLGSSSPSLLGSITKVSTQTGNFIHDVDLDYIKRPSKKSQNYLERIQAQPIKLISAAFDRQLNNINTLPDELRREALENAEENQEIVDNQGNQNIQLHETRYSDYAKYATKEAITCLNDMNEIVKEYAVVDPSNGDFTTLHQKYQAPLDRLEDKGIGKDKIFGMYWVQYPGKFAELQKLRDEKKGFEDQKKEIENQARPLSKEDTDKISNIDAEIKNVNKDIEDYKKDIKSSIIDWLKGDIKNHLDKSIQKYNECTEGLTNLLRTHPQALDAESEAAISQLQQIKDRFNAENLTKSANGLKEHVDTLIKRYEAILEGRPLNPDINLEPIN